jgi:hypothetical protein
VGAGSARADQDPTNPHNWRAGPSGWGTGSGATCEAVTEEKLAVKLAKVAERLDAGAPNTELPGPDLIAYYLSPEKRASGSPM